MGFDTIVKIFVVVSAALIGVGSMFVGKYRGIADNPIEQKSEEIIKRNTGIDIDLSPEETTPKLT